MLLNPISDLPSSGNTSPKRTDTFSILLRAGVFQQAPDILQGQDVDIEYVSPLAKAQKSGDLNAVMRGIEIFGAMSQFAPVLDYLDADGLAKYVQNTLGLPAKVMRSDGQVRQIRKQRAEAEAAAMQQQQMMEEAKALGQAAPMVKAVK